ncbi:MAG: hypothetical protein QXN35_05705 [Ignisphaera sp.]
MKFEEEAILARRRNAAVDNIEVDLLVETDRSIYIVEVKVRPSIEDVGSLIAKAEVVEKRFGKPAVAILAGALIGDDVRAYVESRGIKIYSY